MQPHEAEELARARLAYVSAGRRPLNAPRRALHEQELVDLDEPVPPGTDEAHPAELPAPNAPAARPAIGRVTSRHVIVVAVLLLCSVGVAIAALGRSVATEVPVQPLVVESAAPGPPSPSPTPMVRVHVAGAVAIPGVVTIADGSIVQDAIAAAGGLTSEADPALLNLAAPVSDGMQIAIGTHEEPLGDITGESGGTGGAGSAPGPLDLNSATLADLEGLPGVGPVTAQAILAWREEHGRFTAVEELQEISGIGPKTFQKLSPLVQVR